MNNVQFAIPTKTNEEFNNLLLYLEKKGFRWSNGTKPTAAINGAVFDAFTKETCIAIQMNNILGCTNIEIAKEKAYKLISVKDYMKNFKVPKANFLLKYNLDEDPIEEFETIKEVDAQIAYLVENNRSLKRESFVIYTISKKQTVKVSTRITKKLVK